MLALYLFALRGAQLFFKPLPLRQFIIHYLSYIMFSSFVF